MHSPIFPCSLHIPVLPPRPPTASTALGLVLLGLLVCVLFSLSAAASPPDAQYSNYVIYAPEIRNRSVVYPGYGAGLQYNHDSSIAFFDGRSVLPMPLPTGAATAALQQPHKCTHPFAHPFAHPHPFTHYSCPGGLSSGTRIPWPPRARRGSSTTSPPRRRLMARGRRQWPSFQTRLQA